MCKRNASRGKRERWQPPRANADKKSSVNGRLMRIVKSLNCSGQGTASNAPGIEDRSCANRIRILTWPTRFWPEVDSADLRVAHLRRTRQHTVPYNGAPKH